ncbi:MAG: ATP-dependent Clp protease ATP-binding subunit [Candidatus Nomurabacteria bacterium]|nr:ATP-dependent Clp protease ATP-binding subunit [Candidatus Nomurabacteria bacterium]
MDLKFNYRDLRAIKARFNRRFGKILKITSLISVILLTLGGGALLIIGVSVGWLMISLVAYPMMLYVWQVRDLAKLPPSGNSLAGVMDNDLLGFLPDNPSPRDIATAVMQTNGGHFFHARFGVPPQFLLELGSDDPKSSDAVWEVAWRVHQSIAKADDPLSAATIMVALIQTQSALTSVLSTLQLDLDDIINGAKWYVSLTKLIETHRQPKLTGGIARDWSFGYIPTLERYGVNLSTKYVAGRSFNVRLDSNSQLVQTMIDTFSGGGKQNIALIGPFGSGKRTVIETFAEELMNPSAEIPPDLKYRQIISLDAGALLGATPGRGELENLISQVLVEVFHAKNIIICLENAQLFFEDGTGSIDITNILLPILEGGAFRLILTLDEQRYLQIAERNPALASTLNRLQVQPTNEVDTMQIMQNQLISIEFGHKVTFMYQALKETYRLSERYIQDVAEPRSALQLLEATANKTGRGLVTARNVRDTIEAMTGVKVGATDDETERNKLLNLESLIHERMINQTAAVNAVASALRRARAGVRNENRPIGTFLFLGPTGVGKTELAKSLAEVYFGGEDHLVRIDLNEYVRAEDVARLIADAATNAGSLSAQVQKNPFSVVLLDEIEKAHPNVLTTLLQVLDEGILRDINNRQISFRDTILIATSNAGANRIREHIEAGHQLAQFADEIQNELIERQEFRPEFLNRFDEIVIFRPLNKDELLQVVDLILSGINKNLALQKVSVVVDDDAKRALVDTGYDPRLGARPMRRVVQRTVENIVAKKMLKQELTAGESLKITLLDIQKSSYDL